MPIEPLNIPDEEFVLLYLEYLQELGITSRYIGYSTYNELGRAVFNWWILGRETRDPRMTQVKRTFNTFLKRLDVTPEMTKRGRSTVFAEELTLGAEEVPEEILHPEIVQRRLRFLRDTRTPVI